MKAKASDIVTLRAICSGRGTEAGLLAALSPEAQRVYRTVAASAWIALPIAFEIYSQAALRMYPTEHEPERRLGREIGRIQMTGIYKVFLRIATPEFLVRRVTHLWRTFYDCGQAGIEALTRDSGVLVVKEFPELVHSQREYIAGYLIALLELTGARGVRVSVLENDPQAWRWLLSWMR
jgi:uncharacterized protein (TIGR02265 family)